MGHIERKERERENIHQRLLQAALDIAKAEGWQGVTIRKIANAVEYTTSVVYGHFESKELLLQEIIDNGFTALYGKFIKTYKKESDPHKQLMDLSLIFWNFGLKNKELYQLMLSSGTPSNKTLLEAAPMLNDIMQKISGKSEKEANSLVLNWTCLREGAITRLLYLMKKGNDEGQQLYTDFMERFIKSISR